MLAGLAPLFAQARVTMGEIWNASYLGEAFWRAGRLAEAGETLRALIDRAGQFGMRFYLGGDQDEAHRYLSLALGIFERLGTLAEPDQVREDLARLGCGPVS